MAIDLAEDLEFKRIMSDKDHDGGDADDSLLIEDLLDENNKSGGAGRLKRSSYSENDLRNKVKTLNERIKQAELLLCANLENLTSQQGYYEGEIAKSKD